MKRLPVSNLVISLVPLVLIIAVLIFSFWASKENYVVLSSKLKDEEFVAAVRSLKRSKIRFEVDKDSRIMVPETSIEKGRIALSDTGLDTSGVVGYEIFDKQNFGTTSSIQSINRQRALVGELTRTIKHIEGIEKCRVHLSIPRKNPFVKASSREGRASVVLGLKKGYKMKDFQVKSIKNIVASAVPNLSSKNVTIVNMSGTQFLTQTSSPIAHISLNHKLEQKLKYERELENKVVNILSKVIPKKFFEAKVTAEINYVYEQNKGKSLHFNDINNFFSSYKEFINLIPKKKGSSFFSSLKGEPIGIKVQSLFATIIIDKNYIDSKNKKQAKYFFELSKIKSIVASTIGWKKSRDPSLQVKILPFENNKVYLAESNIFAKKVAKNNFLSNIIYSFGIFTFILLSFLLIFLLVKFIGILFKHITFFKEKEEFIPKTLKELEKEHKVEDISIDSSVDKKFNENSTFEDLIVLDDFILQEALKNVSDKTILIAITTSMNDMKNKILRNLSKERVASIEDGMEYSVPGRIYDVERCQDEILSIVKNQDSHGFFSQKIRNGKKFFFGNRENH